MKTDLLLTNDRLTRGLGAARFLSLALASAVGLLALSSPSLVATPVYAGLGFGVSSTQYGGQPIVYVSDHASWGVLGSPLSVSATATDRGATAYGSESATWAPDGNSGTLVADYGWSIRAPEGTTSSVGTGDSGPNWEYSFIADATGNFVLNYDVAGSGDTLFGLQGFRIGEHGYFDLGYALVDNAHPSVSGQYVFAVTQGQGYDFQLVNLGNISGTIQKLDASVHAEFDWTLPGAVANSVPESTSTVAFLGLGLGVLGFMSRQPRRGMA